MYKVLLVDDERKILEGISAIVDWESHGTVLSGTAKNGQEALDFISQYKPEIVISDIRMPGIDGLQLVEKTKEKFPSTEFIILSGFDEFAYARKAMGHGVKHYLLKPCNEQSIAKALQEIVQDLNQKENRDLFLQNMEHELKRVLPHVKEQFLKELVTNKTYGKRDWEDFSRLFDLVLEDQKVRILLFQLEGQFEFEHMFAIKNIAEDIIDQHVMLLSSTIGQQVLILIKDELSQQMLFQLINEIRTTFSRFYHLGMTVALSEAGDITRARQMYREALDCLNHRFYLGEGSLITKKDIQVSQPQQETLEIDEGRLTLLIKAGRWEDVSTELDVIFNYLQDMRLEMYVAKSYMFQIYFSVIRQSEPEEMPGLLKEVANMEELDTLHSLKEFIISAAQKITEYNFEINVRKNSNIVQKVMDIIEENLENPSLSLQWVAGEMVYMNADYLGKLFKKETGEKFSNYVTKKRIQQAAEYITRENEFKVFELAEKFGFGDNPQYFSQVFKKVTGFTPSEFLKKSPS